MLDEHGLILRGHLNFENDKPSLPNGELAGSVALIGHGGATHWTRFRHWQDTKHWQDTRHWQYTRHWQDTSAIGVPNPLDDWSKLIITAITGAVGGCAVFPSDQPYLPFQRWAYLAEGLRPSPLGLLIHPVFGLWHAYRGAIIFAHQNLEQVPVKLMHPCDTCEEKPCLSACPVEAFSSIGYDVEKCRDHLDSEAGQRCLADGCLSRLACPIGTEFQYSADQMQFHMRAFTKKDDTLKG